MKIVIASLAALAVVSPALAQGSGPEYSVSAGYSLWNADDADLGAITLRGTGMFTPNFGVEGEAAFGVGDENVGGATVEINNSLGAFGVAKAPLTDQFDIFARAGYATTEIEASGFGASASADIDGFAYGIGGNFYVNENFGIRGDFSQYDGGDDVDGAADVFSIAGVVRF